jgi:nitrogen fixation-related uncharacterized protein
LAYCGINIVIVAVGVALVLWGTAVGQRRAAKHDAVSVG